MLACAVSAHARQPMAHLPFVALACLLAACGAAAGGTVVSHPHRLATRDGLALGPSADEGRLEWLATPGFRTDQSRPGLAAAGSARTIGISLYDPDGRVLLDHQRVPGTAAASAQAVEIERAGAGLSVRETWTAMPRYLALHAKIRVARESGAPRDRAIEACLRIPVDLVGRRWHHHLHQSEIIRPENRYQTLLTESVDIGHWSPAGGGQHLKSDLPYNLHGLTLVGDDTFGLALAAAPEQPAAYYARYDSRAGELSACFHLGIYGRHARTPSSASIALLLFHPDQPSWGMRSALAKYFEIRPDGFRGALPRQTGMTVGGAYNYRLYPDPARFHIGAMWNGFFAENRRHGVKSLLYSWPTGFIDRGMRLGKTAVTGPCTGCDPSIDAHVAACLAIYAAYDAGQNPFAHTCKGLWSLDRCQETERGAAPVTYGPVKVGGSFYTVRPMRVVEPSRLLLRLFGQFAIHAPLGASLLRDADGRYRGVLSSAQALTPAQGDSNDDSAYTCYLNGLNPDPGIDLSDPIDPIGRVDPAGGKGPGPAKQSAGEPPYATANFGQLNLEIARRATGVYGPTYVHTDERGTPVVYDGVAVDTVGAYLRPDFNPDRLRLASLPLGYDRASGRVVVLEHLSLTAFLAALRRALPGPGAVASNGFPISGTLGQDIDFFVRELGRRLRKAPGEPEARFHDELYDEDLALRLRRIYRARMVAYKRSITFWARFGRSQELATATRTPARALLDDMRRLLPLYTAQGIYLYMQDTGITGARSFFQSPQPAEITAEYERHLDTVHALTVAGWEPVPYARASDPAVVVERFGNTFITLYSGAERDLSIALTIDWHALDRGHTRRPPRIVDRASGRAVAAELAGNQLVVRAMRMAPGSARVLAIDWQ